MIAPGQLQLVLVTPEKTLLDEPVASLRFPLFDGQIGILPGRAPLVGRLGYGELRINTQKGEKSYFIDGGFVQVKGSTVSILTSKSMLTSAINVAEAEEELATALAGVPTTDIEFALKEAEVERARQLTSLGRRNV